LFQTICFVETVSEEMLFTSRDRTKNYKYFVFAEFEILNVKLGTRVSSGL
jgi:hypothetical protein